MRLPAKGRHPRVAAVDTVAEAEAVIVTADDVHEADLETGAADTAPGADRTIDDEDPEAGMTEGAAVEVDLTTEDAVAAAEATTEDADNLSKQPARSKQKSKLVNHKNRPSVKLVLLSRFLILPSLLCIQTLDLI